MILQGFSRSWHHLPLNNLGNTVQCQQQKYSSVKAKTHNLKWYIQLKIWNFRVAHKSSVTIVSVPFSLINLLSSANLNLELHVVSTFWLESDTSGTFSLYFAQPSLKLQIPALKMHILWCITDTCSWKLSANLTLMLDNPFPVPFLCKLKHISVFSSWTAWKSPANSWFPTEKTTFFKVIPGVLGRSINNTEISIKTACVSRLSFRFLWLWGHALFFPPHTHLE